jgi:hypothetical protein
LFVDRFSFQVLESFLCSWRSGVGLGIGFHESSNDPIQSLLGVHCITMHSICWIKKIQDILQASSQTGWRTSGAFLTVMVMSGWWRYNVA